jgi:hypothetical protein
MFVRVPKVCTSGSGVRQQGVYMARRLTSHTNQVQHAHNIGIVFAVGGEHLLPRWQNTTPKTSQTSASARRVTSAIRCLRTFRGICPSSLKIAEGPRNIIWARLNRLKTSRLLRSRGLSLNNRGHERLGSMQPGQIILSRLVEDRSLWSRCTTPATDSSRIRKIALLGLVSVRPS